MRRRGVISAVCVFEAGKAGPAAGYAWIYDTHGPETLVLSVGGGPGRENPRAINLNLDAFDSVDIVGDGTNLPLVDGSMDTVTAKCDHPPETHAGGIPARARARRGGPRVDHLAVTLLTLTGIVFFSDFLFGAGEARSSLFAQMQDLGPPSEGGSRSRLRRDLATFKGCKTALGGQSRR